MAKFYGVVGYTETIETRPGVWEPKVTERSYYGDVLKNTRRLQSGESTNDNIVISNNISIVADAYALQNFYNISYIEWMGAKWKVSEVDALNMPRLILTLGGLYNGS